MAITRTADFGKNFTVSLMTYKEELIIDPSDIEYVYFVEDIFSVCIEGKLQFHDHRGLLEYPLTGIEQIILVYGHDKEYTLTFDILCVNSIKGTGSNAGSDNILEIDFVDESYNILIQKQFSRSWHNEKHSDIIKHITEKMVNTFKSGELWEDSSSKCDFAMPYWTPITAFRWLMKRGKGAESNHASYCIFNNIENKKIYTNFVTLEKLLQNKELMKIEDPDRDYNVQDTGKYNFSDPQTSMNRILWSEIIGLDKMSYNDLKGGHRLGYDFMRKKFINLEFDYSTEINNLTMFGKKSLFHDMSDNKYNFRLTSEPNEDTIKNMYQWNWSRRYMVQQIIKVGVRGHEQRKLGGVIKIEWPSIDSNELYNKSLYGNYLIKGISHWFQPRAQTIYTQKLVLLKNAHYNVENSNLLSSSKKNIASLS